MKNWRSIFLTLAIVFGLIWAGPAVAADITSYSEGGGLSNAPDYAWWYGCSPTSAGMLMAYYDLYGYAGLDYDNLIPGGDAELTSYGGFPSAVAPLATSAIASAGHIADFYVTGYGTSGDDYTGGSTPHTFDSLADFMGTSQDSVGNVNGSTTFYYYTNGAPLPAADMVLYGLQDPSGMYGIGEYASYTGYGYTELYNQYIDTLGLTYGFSFADYMSYIDDGAPVLIHVEGHTMLGYGYDAASSLVYLYDTWGPSDPQNPYTMVWGGTYYGLTHYGVTVFTPSGGSAVPIPAAVWLLGSGLIGLAGYRRKFQN